METTQQQPIVNDMPLQPNDLTDIITTVPPKKNNKETLTITIGIVLSQLISLLSVSNGMFSRQLEVNKHCVTPLIYTSTYYFLLFIVWLCINRSISKPKLIYILLTFIDSQANFINVYVFTIIRFEYPYIINFSSAVWSFLLTLIIIKKYKYTTTHFIGIAISLFGIIIAILGTFDQLNHIHLLFNNMKGLLICIGNSLLYALNSVLQEKYLNENNNINNYFIWSGLIGSIITFSESFVFNELWTIMNNVYIDIYFILYWIAFAVSLCLIASVSPFFIMKYSATMFNIGMACTVFWSFILNIFIQIDANTEFNIFYFVGFGFIIGGIIMFNYKKVIYSN